MTVRPLSGARCGRDLVVTRILFDEVRSACAGLGIAEGSLIRCVRQDERCVHFDGGCLPRPLSRFVEVACALHPLTVTAAR